MVRSIVGFEGVALGDRRVAADGRDVDHAVAVRGDEGRGSAHVVCAADLTGMHNRAGVGVGVGQKRGRG